MTVLILQITSVFLSYLDIFKRIYLFYFMYVSVFPEYIPHVYPGAQIGQKRSSEYLELELQIVISHGWVLGTKSGSSPRATSILNC